MRCDKVTARFFLGKDAMRYVSIIVSAALSTSLSIAGAIAGGTCTIYENRDFGGAHWTLHDRDDMQMINPPDVGTSDSIHRFLYERSWNDKVSSFKLTRGCTITLWENVGKGGHHFRTDKSYSALGDWNDVASEAECDCGGKGLSNF
jgi:syncollin